MYRIFSYICLKNCPNVGKYSIHGASGLYSKHWFPADVPFGESKKWLRDAVRCYHDILWQSFISLQWKALVWSEQTHIPIWMGNVLCVAMLWLISEECTILVPGRFDEGGWTRIFISTFATTKWARAKPLNNTVKAGLLQRPLQGEVCQSHPK